MVWCGVVRGRREEESGFADVAECKIWLDGWESNISCFLGGGRVGPGGDELSTVFGWEVVAVDADSSRQMSTF